MTERHHIGAAPSEIVVEEVRVRGREDVFPHGVFWRTVRHVDASSPIVGRDLSWEAARKSLLSSSRVLGRPQRRPHAALGLNSPTSPVEGGLVVVPQDADAPMSRRTACTTSLGERPVADDVARSSIPSSSPPRRGQPRGPPGWSGCRRGRRRCHVSLCARHLRSVTVLTA